MALWEMFDQMKAKELEKPFSSVLSENQCTRCFAELRPCEGALVCVDCGTMHDDVDMSAEWRCYFGDDSFGTNPARCGLPVNPDLPESSLGCKILGAPGKANVVMRNIHRYMNWQAMPYREKTHHEDFKHITTMASAAGIPKMIIENACRYHKMISEKQTFRGSNRDGIIAASIYIACRKKNYPRTAKEIAFMFHLNTASATKGCKNAMTIMNEMDCDAVYTTTNALSFIERYCSLLQMPANLIKVAEFISMQIMKKNLIPEKTPHSVAAGIIYFISHEFMDLSIKKEEIRTVIHISSMTIDKCFKTIYAAKAELVPAAVYAMFKK